MTSETFDRNDSNPKAESSDGKADSVETKTGLEQIRWRRLDEDAYVIIFLDWIEHGQHSVLVAIGVNREGEKHVLGLEYGAPSNSMVVPHLLQNLIDRGLDANAGRLFVIKDTFLKNRVMVLFGSNVFFQLCRKHKVEEMTYPLPKELSAKARMKLKTAFRLPFDRGLRLLNELVEEMRFDRTIRAHTARRVG